MEKRVSDKDYWKLVWTNFKAGDRTSFEIIYNEFTDTLFAYGSRITADKELLKDAIQDVFIAVYKYGPDLRKPESLEFYLFKSLKRNIIRKIKEARFTADLPAFELKFNLEEEIIPDECDNERLLILQKLVQSLDPSQRELLFLKFNSGLTYPEIGQLLNLKPDTVKKQVYRLLDHLRSEIGNDLTGLLCIFGGVGKPRQISN
ncbi:MAG: sigma-70 family RNA polymerase sigma factor [Prolixibacteraceae bacterium]